MTALLKKALDFLTQLKRKNLFPYDGVELADGKRLSYEDWVEKEKVLNILGNPLI